MSANKDPYLLLVEDSPGDARLVREMFRDAPPTFALPVLRWAETLAQARKMLEGERRCEAVLLDLGLPDSSGLATLQMIKDMARGAPIVVLSSVDDDEVGVAAVIAGAQDFLVKGSFEAAELRRALRYAQHRQRVEHALTQRALHDELTGLPKRALLLDRIEMALKRSVRNQQRGALLFVDLDAFKPINDLHGHAAGDAVLKAVAERMRQSVRASDTIARLGGDEFVVLLPEIAAPGDGAEVGRKLIALLSTPLPYQQVELSVGASVGVVEFCGDELPPDELMKRADAAMYEAKRAGKGTVR